MTFRAFAIAFLVAATAHALPLDPSRVPEQVRVMRERGEDGFCRHPNAPVRGHARALCDHAKAVPECGALVTACDADEPKPDQAFAPWLVAVARILLFALAGVLAVAALAALFFVLRGIRRSTPSSEPIIEEKKERSPAPKGTDAPRDLLALADEMRTKDPERALTLYLRAALGALDLKGSIHAAEDRTNGEYVRECTDSSAKKPLRTLAAEVEQVRFGRRSVSAEGIDRAARAAVAIVLATMFLSSCSAFKRVQSGSDADPSAPTMLARVLSEQGVEVKASGSLVHLQLPKEPEDAPALLIDMQTIEVEPEARAHLRAWVEAGGSLILAGAVPREVVPGIDPALADSTTVEFAGYSGTTARPQGLKFPQATGCVPTAMIGSTPFAVECSVGEGLVIAMASDDLIANIGFVRGKNSALAVALIGRGIPAKLLIATPTDGTSPPDSPFASLERAGLALGMWHALAAALLLFWAHARLGRPRPTPPETRRAFSEHVEATGALYARARASLHALSALVRFVEERARGDVPTHLAHRSGLERDHCERVWSRAKSPATGRELEALRDLHAVMEKTR